MPPRLSHEMASFCVVSRRVFCTWCAILSKASRKCSLWAGIDPDGLVATCRKRWISSFWNQCSRYRPGARYGHSLYKNVSPRLSMGGESQMSQLNVSMRNLLIAMAAIEVGAGVALLVSPSWMVPLLVGGMFDTLAGVVVGRIAGTALLTLGVACWLARNDGTSRAAIGLVIAMFLYNVGVVTILSLARIELALDGVAFWPAVFIHAIIGLWCLLCLWHRWGRLRQVEE